MSKTITDIEVSDKNEKCFKTGSMDDIYKGNYTMLVIGNNRVNTASIFS